MLVTDLPALPSRPDEGHKGTFGRIGLIGGWPGMTGSIALSGMAALRSGAGLVTILCPAESAASVAAHDPCYMTKPWTSEREQMPTGLDAVGFGPGYDGGGLAEVAWLRHLSEQRCPTVLDAGGLAAITSEPIHDAVVTGHELIRQCEQPVVLTPHPGEFARMTGLTTTVINDNRRSLAEEWAGRLRCVLVLKGAGTVVSDGSRTAVNGTGNSGMATGGTGDVLTGLITTLLAQGLSAWDAARLGTHAHGLAGDIAAERLGQRGMTAFDVVHALPQAWQSLESSSIGDQASP